MDKQNFMFYSERKKLADEYEKWVNQPLQDGAKIKDCALSVITFMQIKGFCKIPEKAVVLTREELKEKIDCCDVSMIHHDDDGKRYIEYEKYEDFTDRLGKRIQQLKGQLKQERKETAEKFAERLKELTRTAWIDDDHYEWIVDLDDIDEICKELTEG